VSALRIAEKRKLATG